MNNCSTVFYDLKNAYDTSIYILRLELQELLWQFKHMQEYTFDSNFMHFGKIYSKRGM